MNDVKWIVPVAIFLFASSAYAGQTLAEHIRDDPACRQFNDGCSICRIEDDAGQCSAPSIACIVTDWVCVDPGSANAGKPVTEGQEMGSP